MRIGYYFAQTQHGDGGIYQYALYILKLMIKNPGIRELVIIYSKGQESLLEEYQEHPKVQMVKHKASGFFYSFFFSLSEFILKRYYLKGKKHPWLRNAYRFFNPDSGFFNRLKLDALQVPRQLSPIYNLKYPVMITMHDLQQMYFPEFFSPQERMYKAISYYIAIEECDHIIVSYPHVKKDIIKYFQVPDEKVSVCEVPFDIDWFSSQNIQSKEEILKKYNIPEDFILTPAATWPHKNHISVIKALRLLKKQNLHVFWVATGNKNDHFDEILKPEITEAGLENNILFPGIVSDEDLVALYHASQTCCNTNTL